MLSSINYSHLVDFGSSSNKEVKANDSSQQSIQKQQDDSEDLATMAIEEGAIPE